MAHRPVTNKSVEQENRKVYHWWRQILTDFFLSCYKWKDFPFDSAIAYDVYNYMNETFLYGGCLGFTYVDLENMQIPICGQATATERATWYGGAIAYDIITYTESFRRSIDDVALCYNSPTRQPMITTIEIYADMLTKTMQAMKVNLYSQNTPAIIRAPEGQELTYANIFEEVAGHKPVVYGRDTAFNEEEKNFFYLTPAQYVADKLQLEIFNLLNMYFFQLGVSPLPFEKKAQIQREEINVTKQSLDLAGNSMLDSRKRFCDRINERFGLHTSVEMNFTGEFVRQQILNTINEYPGRVDVNDVLEQNGRMDIESEEHL